jgi:hypothetical protein
MRLGDYPTPAQIVVQLGDVWLDDALRIELHDQNPKIPVYGYNEVRPGAFVQGRAFVSGSIAINYRFPGYLDSAAGMVSDAVEEGKIKYRLDEMVQWVSKIRNATVAERINMLEGARQVGNLDQMGKALEIALRGKPTNTSIPTIINRDASQGFTIRIYFDTPDSAIYYRAIEGVRFTGKQMVANNSAGAGGDMSSSGRPLLEVYTFLGTQVTDYRSDVVLQTTTKGTSESQLVFGPDNFV